MKNPTDEFKVGDRVVFIPFHAHGNPDHGDCEYGVVTSKSTRDVFVRFSEDVSRTSKACKPEQLQKL